jgi:hypothetical protein
MSKRQKICVQMRDKHTKAKCCEVSNTAGAIQNIFAKTKNKGPAMLHAPGPILFAMAAIGMIAPSIFFLRQCPQQSESRPQTNAGRAVAARAYR